MAAWRSLLTSDEPRSVELRLSWPRSRLTSSGPTPLRSHEEAATQNGRTDAEICGIQSRTYSMPRLDVATVIPAAD